MTEVGGTCLPQAWVQVAKRKTISRQQITGERGYHVFSERVMAAGLTFHQTGRLEAGIDGFIELRDPDTGEVRAQFVGAQIKTRESGRFSEETQAAFSFSVDVRDLDYWLSSNAPVILVVVRLEDQLICWKSIQGWFDTPAKKASRKIVFDKAADLLTKASAPALAQMVASFGKPGTMVPPTRTDERLDTNLLRAIFPAQVNIASTDLSYVEIRQAMLQVEDPAPIDWVSYGKRIISFRDLDGPLFKAVAESGTAEPIGTLAWARSDGEVTRREFVNLLRRCLSQRMKGRLFFHREKRILVFPRGRTIAWRLRYRSYEKTAWRSVVKACGKKKGGSGPSYYRHAAFFPRFLEIGDDWFLATEPTYHFTLDGYEEYPFEAERLSGIKRLENNQSVRSHIGLWRAVLTQEGDLLRSEYPFLRFESTPALSCRFGVPDDVWRNHEDEEVTDRFAEAQRDLFE